jgi:Ca-activated chloride channel family protein
MSQNSLFPQDPKFTAYALGELEGEERAAVEAALRDNPAARAAVEDIRATAAHLAAALAAEPVSEHEAGISAEGSLARPTVGKPVEKPRGPLPRYTKATILKFPQLYYVVGLGAAACFALFVALRQPVPHPARPPVASNDERVFTTTIDLRPSATEAGSEPAANNPASLPSGVPRLADATPTSERKIPQAGVALWGYEVSAEKDGTSRTRGIPADPASIAAPKIARAVTPTAANAPGGLSVMTREFADSFGIDSPRNTESYAFNPDTGFVTAEQHPLSTFSVDVDTASYANVRRFIQGGRLPPADAVRIEEMLNYFPYSFAEPKQDEPIGVTLEVAAAPWAPAHRLVLVGLKAREVETKDRPPANLVFLVDVSGSMNDPKKLPLVKEAMRLLVGKLRPDDHVAIVTYAGQSGLALPSTPVARSREILEALEALSPGGSTNGAMGIQLAYDIAKANFVADGLNRVILCTDGDFNVGVSSEGELTRLVGEKAKSGVFLTVLGFGMGNLKDSTLEKLADTGNGNYGYIDTRREAEKLLVEQVNGTLMTVAKDVKIQVDFNPAKVASYRLIGYENRRLKKEDFNNDAVDAGDVGAGHTVTALYEIIPVGIEDDAAKALGRVDESRYAKTSQAAPVVKSGKSEAGVSAELLTVKVRYKNPRGLVSQRLDFPLTDSGAGFASASRDFRLAAAVAGFGMVLRDSPFKGTAAIADILAWMGSETGEDRGGYRREFADLVGAARRLMR